MKESLITFSIIVNLEMIASCAFLMIYNHIRKEAKNQVQPRM